MAAGPGVPSVPSEKLAVGYWAIRGLGAPCRMMCEYAEAPYDSFAYTAHAKEGGGWDVAEWFGCKPELVAKHALMNLPYVVDGDLVVTQTNACMGYLGRKFKLMGADEAQMTKVEAVLCEVMDLRNNAVKLFYGGPADAEAFKAAVVEHLNGSVKGSYGKLEAYTAQNGGTYSAGGETPTAGDFHVWEMLDQHETLAKDYGQASPLEGNPKLTALYAAFRALPTLQKYFDGDLYKLPPNNKMAKWGGGN